MTEKFVQVRNDPGRAIAKTTITINHAPIRA
jgi:hypothetical protein